ncbi:hypothetical protein IscW_ISCW002437 [Ixodes scapularis]|uniref:Uncharacterized protein n=1 Tax=Ixodes scapularis TaxID=6945 RepID=B7P8M2_IXOSC|nr:hypothetical protein IscW_ISCW002437 [Ixodes scapularis]|eukprot:XP_002402485.1 hypothetical protein IscW_ISCW002437 [Ixodes scapularis]
MEKFEIQYSISPSFKKHLRDFVRGVLSPSKLVVKTWYGVPLTALELCKFVESTEPCLESDDKSLNLPEWSAVRCLSLSQ